MFLKVAMELFRRVFGGRARDQGDAKSLTHFDGGHAGKGPRPADTVLAVLDIDAAINSHERWKARLMEYLEGGNSEGMDPALLRQEDQSALGRWLHGVGGDILGDQPAFALLLVRHRYFHEQAALLVELAQKGQWDKAVHVLNGGYRYGSSQVVLLLRELQRGVG